MKALIERFLENLRIERNASENTLRGYGKDLEQFREFLLSTGQYGNEEGSDVAVEKIDHLAIRAFLSQLYRFRKKSSLARKLAAQRSFFRYLIAEGFLSQSAAEIVATPKQEKTLARLSPVDEIFALMETPDDSAIWGARDRAILETLYSCGIRVGELVGLNLEEVDFSLGIARVFGKGRKERIVPVGEKALRAIRKYIPLRAKYPAYRLEGTGGPCLLIGGEEDSLPGALLGSCKNIY